MIKDFIKIIKLWKQSVKEHKAEERINRNLAEKEFLPAAIEVIETPASPLGQTIALLIMGLFIIALAWAYFGRIDIVSTAVGQIIPGGNVKAVQSLEAGVIKAIYIREGQYVKKDDILIKLDPTEAEVDVDQLLSDKKISAIEILRLEAFLNYLQDKPYKFIYDDDSDIFESKELHLLSDINAHEAALEKLKAQKKQIEAEAVTIKAEVNHINGILPLIIEERDAIDRLYKNKISDKASWIQAKREVMEFEFSLVENEQKYQENKLSLETINKEKKQITADKISITIEKLVELKERVKQINLSLQKAEVREQQNSLKAPVSGVVTQLNIHTIGGVIQPAEPLLFIVPDDSELEIEAFALNKDIGFLEMGQEVEIKLESFPFTKYGLMKGRITHLSADAVPHEELGLVYKVKTSLHDDKIKVKDRWVKLTPGMNATVEIKTGDRRVIEFFLSPVLKNGQEALKER